MPCPADCPVIPDSDSRVKVLHGSVEILLGCCSNDMIMVGHEDDVVNKKVIFFNGFPQGLEEDPRDLSLVKPERPVVGPADQVVRVDVLNDSQRASHA